MSQWTANDMPNLQERVAIVTGANSGLGLETTRALAARGAHVVMACRSFDKAREAQDTICGCVPHASLEISSLDLASLASVRNFAAHFLDVHTQLDLLFNNAGVMAFPRCETKDGFEMQFGTNYLGHYALTGLLLPALLATPQSRVVTTTSLAYLFGKINFADLNSRRSYSRWLAYRQSKLANLLFALELQRRLTAVGAGTISVAAHPGYARTGLQGTSATASGSRLEQLAYALSNRTISQTPEMGALPQLRAGTDPDVQGGFLRARPFGRLAGLPDTGETIETGPR